MNETPISDVNAEPPQKQVVLQPPREAIEVESGVITPKTFDQAYRYAAAVHKSGLVPAQFDTIEKVMVGMQYAQELKLNPLTALRQMYIVNGTPQIYGDLPLAIVRKSGHLEYIKETQHASDGLEISSKNNNLEADCSFARTTVKRKGEPEEIREFSWAEAVRAGLDKDKWGDKKTYKNFKKRMLQMRSRSLSLKDIFSDVLMGIAIQEYDDVDQTKDVTPVAPKINLDEILD